MGEAGLRAYDRGDLTASVGLLERATTVLPSDHPRIPLLEDRLFRGFMVRGRLIALPKPTLDICSAHA